MRLRLVLFLFSSALLFSIGVARADVNETGTVVVTGCLEQSPEGAFVVRSHDEQVALRTAGGMDKHLGRTVRVTGRWQDGDEGRRVQVAKIEYVAEGCVSPAAQAAE